MGFLSKLQLIKGDKVIWIIFLLLCVISIVEVYSSSSSLGYKTGNYWFAAFKHTALLGVGIFMMVVLLHIKCTYFKLFTPVLSIIALPMLIFVLFFGVSENDASRWIDLGLFKLQPSEVGKAAMVFVTAQILSAMQTKDGVAPNTMKYVLTAAACFILPIAPENLSTAAMMGAVVFFMMFIGRVPLRQLGSLLSVVVICVICVVGLVFLMGDTTTPEEEKARENMHLTELSATPELQGLDLSAIPESHLKKYEKKEETSKLDKLTHRFGTWKSRMLEFVDNEEVPSSEYDLDKNRQKGYANVAIATSNIVGKGPGNSVQRDFLPQAYSDFIYAIIIEEFGIFGAFFVAILYIILLYRTNHIAKNCKNPFPAYLAMGLALLIVMQALINMCVAVGLFPVTGQPLPLISRGGSSSVINCMYIGIILSISRTAAKRDAPVRETQDVRLATA